MSKSRKLWFVFLICLFTIGNYIFITMFWPTFLQLLNIAQSDPALSGNHSADFHFYAAFLGSIPWVMYILPAVVGVIEAILVLRAPEIIEQARIVYKGLKG